MSNTSFANALKKGEDLHQKIRHAKPPSPVYEYGDLTKYGWAVSEYPSRHLPEAMKKAMRKLDVSVEDSENKHISAMHSKKSKEDPTWAAYWNTYNVSGHAIIADTNNSPTHMIKENAKGKKNEPQTGEALKKSLPEMHHWSDVVSAIWVNTAGEKAKNLRFIFRGKITNQQTIDIMKQTGLSKPGKLDLTWPGKKFDMSTDQGKALLGTDHGSSIAYLLITGKDILGKREPVVTIFTGKHAEGDDEYFMVWELKDA